MIKTTFKILTISFLGIGVLFAQYSPPSEISNLLGKLRGLGDLPKAAGSDKETYALNITTWQMPTGGWFKKYEDKYKNPWNGSEALSDQYNNGEPVGTIDNDATIAELRFLAEQYKVSTSATNKTKFKNSILKGLDYLLAAQFSTGGWPQMYPKRVGTLYSNMGTYNDNAMIRLMVMLKDVVDQKSPFDSGIITDAKRAQLLASLEKGVDYILKTQIINGGKKTVWCQQHHPTTYAPAPARAYELVSKSGSESVGILYFLMNWPNQTAEIQSAVRSGIEWYKATRVLGLKWSEPNFISSPKDTLWYRFYNVEDNTHFFSDRDGAKYFNIEEVSMERRTGYQWGGNYGSTLLSVESKYNPPTIGTSSSTIASSSSTASSSSMPSSSSEISSSSDVILSCAGASCNSILEAETFCEADGVFEDKNLGFSKPGYLNLLNEVNSSARYVIHSDKAQQVDMYIFYANGGTLSRNMQLTLNNSNSPSEISFPISNGWATWNSATVSLNLLAGNNEVNLKSLTLEGAPNLDAFGFKEPGISYGACDAIVNAHNSQLSKSLTINGLFKENQFYLNTAIKGPFELVIRNTMGAEIQRLNASNQKAFEMGSLSKGVYLVEVIQNQNRMSTIRAIKKH